MQIYKVFDSKSEIIFSAKKSITNSISINHLSEVSKYNKINKFHFNYTTTNPLKSIQSWYSDCKFVEASGGIVISNGNFLWIYRNGIWDLPKGKLEYLENFETAALREVREECGLDSSLKIEKLIYISFHTYTENSKKIINTTISANANTALFSNSITLANLFTSIGAFCLLCISIRYSTSFAPYNI